MVEGQRSSDFSVRAWCSQNDVRESAFYWWRRELARRDAEASGSRLLRSAPRKVPALVPVRITANESPADVESSTESPGRIEIFLPHQRCVRLIGPVDRQMLTDVLAVLCDEDANAEATLGTQRRAASRTVRSC